MRVSEYDNTVERIASLHKALGDPTRLRIVNLLAHRGELCVCDVETVLRISQSKASRHLTYLKHAGVATVRRDGTWAYYRLTKGSPVLRAAVREIRKAVADDPLARQDLRAAEKSPRAPACSPIEPSRSS